MPVRSPGRRGIQHRRAPRDTDADLAGYRVYRAAAGGAWQKLADVSAVPNYSDASGEHGKTYRYAISAFDKAGNESERSSPVEIVVP